jgi:predicted Fe-Mo cluster-binding NifX family protein
MKIAVLICGAISRQQEAAISAAGIKVHPFVRGPVQEIITAYESGRLHTAAFALPGCRGRRMGAGRGPGRCRRKSA